MEAQRACELTGEVCGNGCGKPPGQAEGHSGSKDGRSTGKAEREEHREDLSGQSGEKSRARNSGKAKCEGFALFTKAAYHHTLGGCDDRMSLEI